MELRRAASSASTVPNQYPAAMTPIHGMIEYSTINGVPATGPLKKPTYRIFHSSAKPCVWVMSGIITALWSAMIAAPTMPTVRGRSRTSVDIRIMHQPMTQMTPASR